MTHDFYAGWLSLRVGWWFCSLPFAFGAGSLHYAINGLYMKRTATSYILLAVLTLCGCAKRPPVEIDSGMRLVMGTYARVVVVAGDTRIADAAIADALSQLETVDRLMSDYDPNSEIGRVNANAFAGPVPVSPSTFAVIDKSLHYSRLTGGAFDITVGPIMDLWRAAAKTHKQPSDLEIAAAREKVGYEKLITDPNARTIRFAVEGMRLDLGAIAKGYAVDLAVEAAQKTGVLGVMVDLGGNIRCSGRPTRNKTHWLIGLDDPGQDPDAVGTPPLLVLQLKDTAIATSGDYRRFYMVGGRKVSHIMDRTTASDAKGLTSVTVIAPLAVDADALSTAVTVSGPEKGLALIETIPDTEAILIPSPTPEYPAPQFLKTPGADSFIRKQD